MIHKTIDVGKEFSRFPAGRTARDGLYSGHNFNNNLLIPTLKENESVILNFDTVLSCGSSFLEEAFGGLIRDRIFSLEELRERVIFRSKDPMLIAEINQYIDEAASLL